MEGRGGGSKEEVVRGETLLEIVSVGLRLGRAGAEFKVGEEWEAGIDREGGGNGRLEFGFGF